MSTEPLYTDMQLSAIQEIANIGTGNAATALSQMIGASVDIDPPEAEFVDLSSRPTASAPWRRPSSPS